MKILNLYAGIGGNRKLWGNLYEITAVEYNKEIASIYQDYYPNDKVIVADAHQYLLEHYKEFDFIWASPPCPSHADLRRISVQKGNIKAVYPEMALYQEVTLLRHFAPLKTKWVVENVVPYYAPWIHPSITLGKHNFWLNFYIPKTNVSNFQRNMSIEKNSTVYGFNLKKYDIETDKRTILRNLGNPELSNYLLQCAFSSYRSDQKIGMF